MMNSTLEENSDGMGRIFLPTLLLSVKIRPTKYKTSQMLQKTQKPPRNMALLVTPTLLFKLLFADLGSPGINNY